MVKHGSCLFIPSNENILTVLVDYNNPLLQIYTIILIGKITDNI